MKTIHWNTLDSLTQKELLRPQTATKEKKALSDMVAEIISTIRAENDTALKAYTERFDNVTLDNLKVTPEEFEKAHTIDDAHKQAITTAYNNIHRFHTTQVPSNTSLEHDGLNISKEYRAIQKVGLYVPGGKTPLISTVLMLSIPATIAGCQHIIMVTPPNSEGRISPHILYAAQLCGITEIYKIGGAQAIAALAYGTKSIPKVDKIFGPGNKFVTEAKIQVSLDPHGAALDMPAGPSEVLVIANEQANAAFVASDLLAQAEHDADARCLLITTSETLTQKVIQEIEKQQLQLSRKDILKHSMDKALSIIAPDLATCFEISNQYAPEHLILHLENPSQYIPMIQHAGSVFLGAYTPESLGDYASGPNHVLPTYGYAKTYSGLGVLSFMNAITFQEASYEGLKALSSAVETIASLEGLDAHREAVRIRLA